MPAWLISVLIVIATLAARLAISHSFPQPSSAAFFIGTPVIVIGSGLGAKFLQQTRRSGRIHQR